MKGNDQDTGDRPQHCPECQAEWHSNTCADAFHQMLAWDFEDPGVLGSVHHLTVLCYHLQHPSLYSPEGLQHALGFLVEFVDHGESPEATLRSNREALSSTNRKWPISGKPGAHGAYRVVSAWTMTAVDVAAGGGADYPQRVKEWAGSIVKVLRASGNV